MKKYVLGLQKKQPGLYNFIERIYFMFRPKRFKELFLGTKVHEEEWAQRHRLEGNKWIESYKNSLNQPHRKVLISKILKTHPKSVLELGSNCGPNLYLLAKKSSSLKIVGIDINPQSIKMGNTWFKKEKISNVTLLEGKADDLKSIPDKSFDIVFTDAVLIFVGPDKIERVVKELTRIAKKGIILVEWHSIDRNEKGLGYYYKGMYIRNYENLLKRFLKNVKIDINKINKNIWPDKNWQEVGTFIEVKL